MQFRKKTSIFMAVILSLLIAFTTIPVFAVTTMGPIYVVSGTDVDAPKGGSVTFGVDVTDDNGDTMVTWSVSGNASRSTSMSSSTLYIGADETSSSLIVTAVSHADPVQTRVYSVSVKQYDPNAVILPDYVSLSGPGTLNPGGSGALNLYVSGGQNITFSYRVSGATSGSTYVSGNTLYVGNDENASTLTVTAICDQGSSSQASAYVGIYHAPKPTVSITGTPGSIQVGDSGRVNASFTNTNSVSWSVSGNTSSKTSISSSGVLVVGNDERASALTVTAIASSDPSVYASASVGVTQKPEPVTEPVTQPATKPAEPTTRPSAQPSTPTHPTTPSQPTTQPVTQPSTQPTTQSPTTPATQPSVPLAGQPTNNSVQNTSQDNKEAVKTEEPTKANAGVEKVVRSQDEVLKELKSAVTNQVKDIADNKPLQENDDSNMTIKEDTPQTDDLNNSILFASIGGMALLIGAGVLFTYRKKKTN